jgi:hypothetical protein
LILKTVALNFWNFKRTTFHSFESIRL